VLARAEEAVVALPSATVYRNGFEFELDVRCGAGGSRS
jgi:hypothetical protein